MSKKYYSVAETAKLKGCCRQYIWQLISQKKIPGAKKLGSGAWMVPAKWLHDNGLIYMTPIGDVLSTKGAENLATSADDLASSYISARRFIEKA